MKNVQILEVTPYLMHIYKEEPKSKKNNTNNDTNKNIELTLHP